MGWLTRSTPSTACLWAGLIVCVKVNRRILVGAEEDCQEYFFHGRASGQTNFIGCAHKVGSLAGTAHRGHIRAESSPTRLAGTEALVPPECTSAAKSDMYTGDERKRVTRLPAGGPECHE